MTVSHSVHALHVFKLYTCAVCLQSKEDVEKLFFKRALKMCQDVDNQVRLNSCRQLAALGRTAGKEAVQHTILEELLELLKDEDMQVRYCPLLSSVLKQVLSYHVSYLYLATCCLFEPSCPLRYCLGCCLCGCDVIWSINVWTYWFHCITMFQPIVPSMYSAIHHVHPLSNRMFIPPFFE
jgi:hypothetical protein